jgi:hypothetical protein
MIRYLFDWRALCAITGRGSAPRRRWLRDTDVLPPVRLEERIVERDFSAFYQRQSTKILELSKGCSDPALKDQLVEMAADWLKSIPLQDNSAAPAVAAAQEATDV